MKAPGSISEPRVRGEDELRRCECCGAAKDGCRPSLCEKSDHNETVGKLCTFPLRLTVKQGEEWDGASKSGAFVSIFPTGNMTPDFLHSLGHKRPPQQSACRCRGATDYNDLVVYRLGIN